MKYCGFAFLLFVFFLTGSTVRDDSTSPARIERHANFSSQFVKERNIDVWLPPGYDENRSVRYPVLYMHDGQNIFTDSLAFWGLSWGVGKTLQQLGDSIEMPIVVGIWNTNLRFLEYQPRKPYDLVAPSQKKLLHDEFGGDPISDAYLKFIVQELKIFIDKTYRTKTGANDIMGSSMGGLISLYAICEYPAIFRGAGCISTHWPGSLRYPNSGLTDATANYIRDHLPDPINHRLYFDFGTKTLDSLYEPHQRVIDRIVASKGYTLRDNWQTLKFEGADHSERSWNKRVAIPLKFLLNPTH